MKQLRLLPIFVFFVLLAVSCQEDEPEEPILKESPDPNNPESIELYFQSVEEHRFMMSQLLLDDSVIIDEKCPFGDVRCDTVYFTDLNQAKRDCRQDDIYRFEYSNGSIEGFIDDASLVCNPQEVGNRRAFIVELSDSRLVGELTFELEQNQAVNRFFGFFLEVLVHRAFTIWYGVLPT